MALSVEKGVFSGVLGLGGTGALVMWPNQWWVGAAMLLGAASLLIWGVKWRGEHWWKALPRLSNPFRRRGALYTGSMIVSDSELDKKNYLDLSVRAFNGTQHLFQTATIEGTISVDFTPVAGGSSRGGFVLGAPILYFESEKPHKPDAEFVLGTRLFLSPEQVAEFRKQQAEDYQAQLMFEELRIELETKRGRKMRLPLWDGVSLRGSRIALLTGRVHAVKLSAPVVVSAAAGNVS